RSRNSAPIVASETPARSATWYRRTFAQPRSSPSWSAAWRMRSRIALRSPAASLAGRLGSSVIAPSLTGLLEQLRAQLFHGRQLAFDERQRSADLHRGEAEAGSEQAVHRALSDPARDQPEQRGERTSVV